jgi:FkbM family methyltransferase
MKKVGEYWVPDVDLHWFRNRKKTLHNYQNGGNGNQIHHLTQAITYMETMVGAEKLAASIAVDAGANVGAYARELSLKFLHVHAFEPAPDTFACLASNVLDWGLTEKITPWPNAVSDAEAKVGISKVGWLRRSISREITARGTIKALTIDSLKFNDVFFLKLDVEGHEINALSGASCTIERCKPCVMMELKERHLKKGTADLRAHQFLVDKGYRIVLDLGSPVVDRLYVPSY